MTNRGHSTRVGGEFEAMMMRYYEQRLGVRLVRPRTRGVEDIGDIWGIPHTTVECKRRKSTIVAIKLALTELVKEMERTGTPLGAGFIKREGKAQPADQLVVMTAEWHTTLLRMAMAGSFLREVPNEYGVHVPRDGDVWQDEPLPLEDRAYVPPTLETT